jgi:predicted transcriptional regulator
LERPDLYVLARFLDVLQKEGQPMKKTNLQMRVGLNYPRFMEYLQWMVAHGLVSQQKDGDGGEVYSLSQQGLDSYHRLVTWIRDTMQEMRL